MTLILFSLLLIVIAAIYLNRQRRKKLRDSLEQAGTDSVNRVIIGKTRTNLQTQAKRDVAILLGHGWSSAGIYESLIARLEEEGIAYHCPCLSGFGTLNTSILQNIDASNWEADIIEGLELLEQVAKEVIFVGYSISGTLLHRLTDRHSIRSIHLVNPDIYFKPAIMSYFKLVYGLPGKPIARLTEFFGIWFEREPSSKRKCIDVEDPKHSNSAFDYTHGSYNMLHALQQLMVASVETIHTQQIKTPIYLYLGEKSRYLDLFKTIEAFQSLDASRSIRIYPNSGHMLPADSEAGPFVNDLLDDIRSYDTPGAAQPDISSLNTAEMTSLVPLKSRVVSTLNPQQLFSDRTAVDIYIRLGLHNLSHQASMANVARTSLIDEMAERCIHDHDIGHIVNLGAGLCTRIARLSQLPVHWYDLDSERIIALRENLFKRSENHTLITSSILETKWMENLPLNQPLLFIAEGLFLFLDDIDVTTVIERMAKSFPGSYLLFDSYSKRMLQERYHHDLSNLGIRFSSGINDIHAFAKSVSGDVLYNSSIFGDKDLPWSYPVSFLRRFTRFRNMARVTLMRL